MAVAKGGLKTAVKFTPQAKVDNFSISEDDDLGSLGLARKLLSNDGGGAGARIIGITLDSVSAVKADLTKYVNLANFATPISTDVTPAAGGHLHLDNQGNVSLTGDFNYLAVNESVDLTFTYIIRMGNGAFSVTTAKINVVGVNDLATMEGDTSGQAIEDGAAASGVLTVTDLDHDQSHTAAASGSGDNLLGTFTVDADGNWTYTADHAANDHLAAGITATDTFTVSSLDGTASELVTVTIVGTNDVASIDGDAAGSVTEDGTQTAAGKLTVSDVDDGEAHAQAIDGEQGLYGSFSVDADGNWTYNVDNDSIQFLNTGESRFDSFEVFSQDGTDSQLVEITVWGADEPLPPPPTTESVTVKPGTDGDPIHVAIPEGATNVTVTVTASGDFDWNREGFDITGDIAASFRGANEHNSTGNSGPETSDSMTFDVPVTLTGLGDGSIDFLVEFTPQTNPSSTLSFTVDWDLV